MKHLLILGIVLLCLNNTIFAQEAKKELDFSVYDNWKIIKSKSISNNGKWVSYDLTPYKGDAELIVISPNKKLEYRFSRGKDASFSPNSNYIAFKVLPEYLKVRELKLKKIKADKLPKDSLKIILLESKKTFVCADVEKFIIPKKSSDWMAYTYTNKKNIKEKDKKEESKEKSKKKGKSKKYSLVIINPVNNIEHKYKNVSEFNVSENGKSIAFVQQKQDSTKGFSIKVFDTETEKITEIFEAKGVAKKISLDRIGKQIAFIYSSDTTSVKTFKLYHWNLGMLNSLEIEMNKNSLKMPKDWVVSEYCKIWFSKDNSKMFFGTSLKPEIEPKDTLLDEEKIKLDLWSWTDDLLQTEQLVKLKKEKERNYLTVYHVDTKKIVRLSDKNIPVVRTLLNGNADIAFGISDVNYRKEKSWTYPNRCDYYTINLKSGETKKVLEKTNAEVDISPFGNYIFWFDRQKKEWFAKDLKSQKITDLSSSINVNFHYEEHDLPSDVSSYRFAGWTKNDKYFLVYDRYDIWKIDPTGKELPENVTKGKGRANTIKFRYLKLDYEITYIDNKETQFLHAFNETDKKSGYYSIDFEKSSSLKQLIYDDFNFYNLTKAKKSNYFVWHKGSVKEFPNLWYSNIDFKHLQKISDANPQQKKYIWADVELVKWKTFDGKIEEGLLYKPDNFNPKKKYPMLIYFYELKSNGYHNHYFPKPSRSIINPVLYASNDYLVFMPNVRYEVGYPGKSAYNYVVSGTKAMIERGFVDENNIGIEGQSWGGYQVAYIITQTNIFKAASAGAPVSNMTSAYGGIRWKSGLSRMFQYEKTQSRIGATLWENPELYLKNSPLFYADKIKTPLLIFHNDADGAVPWYQGIELFLALRRLRQAVWLVNYNDEPHNLKEKSPNSKDWSKRMMQFFNHYLKGTPAPIWMTKGIPAIKKGKELGYQLDK